VFSWTDEAVEEWQGKEKERGEMLDILKGRTHDKDSREEVLGSYMSALLGLDDETLKQWDDERK
jgi:hypothetical protein